MIESKSKSIMKDAINVLALEHKVSAENIQLLINIKGGSPKFFGMKEFRVVKEITVKELYPVLVDMFQIRQMIPAFVANLIVDTAEKENLLPKNLAIIISTQDDEAKELFVHVYNETTPIKQIIWKDIFGQEAMMKVMAKQG
tara:strand:- start:8 stop:433 length:426 start_codon:yes stop_codon:yes gene_type:complete